jgi:hypothetical protein
VGEEFTKQGHMNYFCLLVGLEKSVELLVSYQNKGDLTQISWLHLIWSWKFWLHVKTSSSTEFDRGNLYIYHIPTCFYIYSYHIQLIKGIGMHVYLPTQIFISFQQTKMYCCFRVQSSLLYGM